VKMAAVAMKTRGLLMHIACATEEDMAVAGFFYGKYYVRRTLEGAECVYCGSPLSEPVHTGEDGEE